MAPVVELDRPLVDRLATFFTDADIARMLLVRTTVPVPVVPVPPIPLPVTGVQLLVEDAMHEYATMWPGSVERTAWLFQLPGGYTGLFLPGGKLHLILPGEINHSCQPRWMRDTSKNCFLFRYQDELRVFNCENNLMTTLRRFNQPPYVFPDINGMGEGRGVSLDGQHLALCSGRHIFVYDFKADKVELEWDSPWAFDSLYITPDNNVLINFYENQGTQLLSAGGLKKIGPPMVRKIAQSGAHMSVTLMDGRPVVIRANGNDDPPLSGCNNGIRSEPEWSSVNLTLPGESGAHVAVSPIGVPNVSQSIVSSVVRDGVTWSYSYGNLRAVLAPQRYAYDSVVVSGPALPQPGSPSAGSLMGTRPKGFP